ncbi:MAG: choice-of-anchor L domain-containing protein [Bacteroidota bacterium]
MKVLQFPPAYRTGLLLSIVILLSSSAFGQLEIIPNQFPFFNSPEEIMETYFEGFGADVTSITYIGDSVAVALFDGAMSNIGLDQGIILTTGHVNDASGPNLNGNKSFANSGGSDNDLENLINPYDNTQDACVFEIDFIPFGDQLKFDFVFGSEEYDEFVCLFNDVFGFFITGPGFPTPTNIALVPGTSDPISVNTINNGGNGCPPTNVQYYINNIGGTTVEYDAFTTVLNAEATVVPCMPYTIKLAIADVNDEVWDSAVFLKAYSFNSNVAEVSEVNFASDNTIKEGCSDSGFELKLFEPAQSDVTIPITLQGDAQNSIDLLQVPNSVTIPMGQDSIFVPLIPIEDGVIESPENLSVMFTLAACFTDTLELMILDNSEVNPQISDQTILPGDTVAVDITNSILTPSQVSYQNNTSQPLPDQTNLTSTIDVNFPELENIDSGVDIRICIDITHPWLGDVDLYMKMPSGHLFNLSTDNGVSGDNYSQTCFTTDATTAIQGLGSANAPFTGDWLPEYDWSALYGLPANGTWTLIVGDDSNGFEGTFNSWSLELSFNNSSIAWSPANAVSCTDCPNPKFFPDTDTEYFLEIDDPYGCAKADTFMIMAPAVLAAPVVACNLTTDNSITFGWLPVSGAMAYEVKVDNGPWQSPSPGPTSHTVTGLVPMTSYTIAVRALDGNGGSSQPTHQSCLTVIENFSYDLDSAFNIACHGEATGAFYFSASGGIPPYSFELNGTTNNDGDFTGLPAGVYSFSISDSNGATFTGALGLSEPNELSFSTTNFTEENCNNCDGSAFALPIGGTQPYTYLWSNGTSDGGINNLCAGLYTLTVTDSNACQATTSFNISSQNTLSIDNIFANGTLCFGESSGQASVSVSSGTQPYTFAWSSGSSTNIATGLNGGLHIVTVSDLAGCQQTAEVFITQPSALTSSASEDASINCFGDSDGQATVFSTGGILPYTYIWDNGQIYQTATGLTAGTHTVTTTDGNLCTAVATVEITSPSQIIAIVSQYHPVFCNGESTGAGIISTSGGTPPYVYLWDNGEVTNPATNLNAGTHSVTAFDNNGCFVSASVDITEPLPLEVNLTSTNPINNDGIATAFIFGGTQPYTYLWNIGATTGEITGLGSGQYSVTVTDASGCTATDVTSLINVGVEEIPGLQNFNLYPNPGSGLFLLQLAFEQQKELEISIYNIIGQQLFSLRENALQLNREIDLTTQSDGVYLLVIKTREGTFTERLVKTK